MVASNLIYTFLAQKKIRSLSSLGAASVKSAVTDSMTNPAAFNQVLYVESGNVRCSWVSSKRRYRSSCWCTKKEMSCTTLCSEVPGSVCQIKEISSSSRTNGLSI